jgi:aminobenzoyl-glutamate utilization protein B
VGPPPLSDEDCEFARALHETLVGADIRETRTVPDELQGCVLHERVGAPFRAGVMSHASTDVGDVSWSVPTAQLLVATMPLGTPGHSWQLTASSGSSVGRKGMLTAAAALALATIELALDQERLDSARAEFLRRTGGQPYRAPIPPGMVPPGDIAPVGDEDEGWQPL